MNKLDERSRDIISQRFLAEKPTLDELSKNIMFQRTHKQIEEKSLGCSKNQYS